jgi:putative ABC transport system permease protein
LAGAYPAFYLSGFNAAKTMKGETVTSAGHMLLRKSLSVFQFSLSVIFVAGVIITNEQLAFMQQGNLGYQRENVVYFPAEGKVSQDVQSFLSEINKLDGISQASSMLGNIISPGDADGWPLKIGEKTVMVHNVAVNHGLIELLSIEVIEGRAFSFDRASDTDKVICNEEAVKALELVDPIGKTINGKEIIGVVRDFHFQSFHQQIKPLVIRLEPQAVTTVLARLTPGQEQNTLRELERVYKAVNPGFVFDYHFLDENFQSLYVAEKRVRAIAQAAAVLAVVITCLGLFGLSSYLIERRSKEVSIRKILGSGVLNILVLLSVDFFKLVMISILIAVPVSVYVARHWLSGYAYRIDLNVWYFVVAPVAIVIVATAALAMQTFKAALISPLNRLRSE